VLAQEGLADVKGTKRIATCTYDTQEYIDHLDNLMNNMRAEQRMDEDWKDSEGHSFATDEERADIEAFFKSHNFPLPTSDPTPPLAPVEFASPAKNAFEIDQSPISVTTAIQEGSPKLELEPSTPTSELTTARLDLDAPVCNVPATEVGKGTDKIILSLCDGIGGAAAALVAAGVNNVTKYIGVEIDPIARQIAKHANPTTSTFPGISQEWHQDIRSITEADIAAFPADSVVGLIAGTPCGDFTRQIALK
jgi:hypothetical protein